MNCDCEQLELHQPLFSANGFRALVGNTHKSGKQEVREVPVVGMVWNDTADFGMLDLVVWYYDFCCLSTIKDGNGICKTYTWIVPPNKPISEALKDAREFLAENKEEDVNLLKEEACVAA